MPQVRHCLDREMKRKSEKERRERKENEKRVRGGVVG
jgi:hypothetical protein